MPGAALLLCLTMTFLLLGGSEPLMKVPDCVCSWSWRLPLVVCHPNVWGAAVALSGASRATSAHKPPGSFRHRLKFTQTNSNLRRVSVRLPSPLRSKKDTCWEDNKKTEGLDKRLSYPWLKCSGSYWKWLGSGEGAVHPWDKISNIRL